MRVRELLAERQLAYTTVVTLLERLVDRGAVSRRKNGRRFVYQPSVEIETMRAVAVRELLGDFFGGSEQAFRSYVLNGAAGILEGGANGESREVPAFLNGAATNAIAASAAAAAASGADGGVTVKSEAEDARLDAVLL